MKYILFTILILSSAAFSTPGDILRSETISGQPGYGIRGLARDWDTDRIWVAGLKVAPYDVVFTSLDISTLTPDTWRVVPSMMRIYDIGYGYTESGSKYLVMNDLCNPITSIIDPSDGSLTGSLPAYYSCNTTGCAVDCSSNYIYLSSYGDGDVVYWDGSQYNDFVFLVGGLNMGTAVGWDHLFILRTNPFYSIEVYRIDGTFVESIGLNNWVGDNFVMGLACGQQDVVGDNESLFFADFVTYRVHEVEVGNYSTPGALEQNSWGQIKASFYR